MRALSPPLRKKLETAVLAARRASESASRAAIEGLGVFADRRPEHLDANQAVLRNGLRAKWRQLGGDEAAKPLLIGECAYEQWHRLLFARFLAENDLLLHPRYQTPVTLADCAELASELGEPDSWWVAARFAAEILPGIFRLDDPCVCLRLAPEGRHDLEEALDGLAPEVFVTDDSLGWVYQFWQKDKKDEVNASERKIGGADLGPVTQLFTENYMVRFLLENSLGAWWSARHPDSPLVKGFEYLRFDDDGKPAAGSFEGWPERVAEVTVMDPCCGSGHFLVEAFSMLWQMRAEEEAIGAIDAQDAVLLDNLFGLELDPRCVQIAMFAVALQAWKAGGGWRQLPIPNIACSGIPVKAPVEEWKALAGGDERLENALVRLHILFRDADTLGSLIDPKRPAGTTDPKAMQPSLEYVASVEMLPLLARAASGEPGDPALAVLGADAASLARATTYLSRRYTLVVTNPPFLGRKNQGVVLGGWLDILFLTGRAEVAVAFLIRLRNLTARACSFASVVPQTLLTLNSYKKIRRHMLDTTTWRLVAQLGPGAFETITGEVVKPILLIASDEIPHKCQVVETLDVSNLHPALEKARGLAEIGLWPRRQSDQRENPDSRFTLSAVATGPQLADVVDVTSGISAGDFPRFGRYFWELPALLYGWVLHQGSVSKSQPYGGRERIFHWERGSGEFYKYVCVRLGEAGVAAWIRGERAWGRQGVAVSRMGTLPVTLYSGELFDQAVSIIIPHDSANLPAIWAFCNSTSFNESVRVLDQKLNVTTGTLVKVPFDQQHWCVVAEEAGPLPRPWSDDSTQWLFEGFPEVSTAPLQVAVGRLLGYRWPEQKESESDDLDAFADPDGIVCLPSVAGEAPAADRVQQVLATAFGDSWSPAKVTELLDQVASKRKNLAEWLRDEFFKHHCALFKNRPFVWHVWDGQKDGFSALVNYHRLDRRTLEKLAFTYLGDWIERQRAEARDEVAGGEPRLSAALLLQRKLEAILEGEDPYDIFVRWKDRHEQPVGWEPDLNDGVRLNVRPFVEAGVLRAPFNIHWKKDRGKNPDGSERHNDVHLSLAEKLDARKRAGGT